MRVKKIFIVALSFITYTMTSQTPIINGNKTVIERKNIKDYNLNREELQNNQLINLKKLNIKINEVKKILEKENVTQYILTKNITELNDLLIEYNKLNSTSELSTINLQEAVQKRQQTLEIITNIMKKINDTNKQIIKNLR